MLMVQASQIKLAEVLYHSDGKLKRLPGASYNNRLFTQNRVFLKKQKAEALAHCRKVFSDCNEKNIVLCVENVDNYVIWVENPDVMWAKPRKDRVSNLSLQAVIEKMRSVNGIKIKDRYYRLKSYPNCFLGTEAVQWFRQKLKLTQEEALHLGQRLMDEEWIHHVNDDHPFKDEALFYRFYWDET